ncbi:hypothetical protein [Psittacicella hinzii]|uniref:Uncharacterized protein n=1 Tax=Psittacicella hinzii TaxID=2028575 RepID=A0A3A1YHI7_9GAMM|nr:hypothetical protein [Psittacicella hinzii]RIY37071.1 hypothetical protein CKF58_05450 [Psittacicella hinzii]
MTEKTELWLGKYGADFAQAMKPIVAEFVASGAFEHLKVLTFNDMYLSGYTYAAQFDNDIDRYLMSMLSLLNQVTNPLAVEGTSDVLNLFLVDNEIEKETVVEIIKPYVANFLQTKLHQFKCFTKVEEIDTAGVGLAILTLDELPSFMVKYQELVKSRTNFIKGFLAWTSEVIEQNQGKDVAISRENISPEQYAKLNELPHVNHDITLKRELEQYLNNEPFTLYELYSHLQSVYEFLTASSETYETSHMVYQRDKDGNDVEVGERVYQYQAAPIGLLYVFNGYLYNNPEYYAQRSHLLTFIKALNPNTFVWCDEAKQEQKLHLETLSRLVVRNVQVKMFECFAPYFLELNSITGNNERVHFNLLLEYQDARNFVTGNGLTSAQNSVLRLAPSKHFSKLRDIDPQLLVSLAFGVLQRTVLVVTNDRAQTTQQIEEICAQVAELRAGAKQLAIVEAKELPFYRGRIEVAVLLKDVEISRNLLADLSCIVDSPSDQYSALIVFGTIKNAKHKRRKAKDGEESIEEEQSLDLVEQQRKVIHDFLRDRRIVRRNTIPNDSTFYYPPSLCNIDLQSADYFEHQEKRNWHSQLSSDKFLTVRFNNREISYYPNLNGNLMVLAGINRNYFSRLGVSTIYERDSKATFKDINIVTNAYHQNLNSGDMITNISIAIHRLINLFTERKKRISYMRNVAAYWIVSDSQAELLSLYSKLFCNIFNKEPDAQVNIKILSEITNAPLEANSVMNSETNPLSDMIIRKMEYENLLLNLEEYKRYLRQHCSQQNPGFEKVQSLLETMEQSDIDQQIYLYIESLRRALSQAGEQDLPLDENMLDSYQYMIDIYDRNKDYKADTEIVLMTQSEYRNYLTNTSPDVIVVENSYDLYQDSTASNFANFVRELFSITGTSTILISSPESSAEELVHTTDSSENRASNTQIVYDLPSAERYAYGVNFSQEDFNDSSYVNFEASAYNYDKLIEALRKDINSAPIAALQAFDLPLTSYALPQESNGDYRIYEKEQLPALRRYGYIPALGEKELEIQLNYLSATPSKIVNTILSLLLQQKNTKSRGLVVVNNPEVKAFLECFANEFSFVVHDFNSLNLERAVFSHAVIVADNDVYLQQAVIQHVSLLTRGFKTTGTIFLLANMEAQTDVLGIIAQDQAYEFGGHLLSVYPNVSQITEQKQIASRMFRYDFFSPYCFLDRATDHYVFKQSPKLPGYRRFTEGGKVESEMKNVSGILNLGVTSANFSHGGKKRNKSKKRR